MDLWLYVSLAGFVVSLLLWFYFFYKYRSPDQPVEEPSTPSIEINLEPTPVKFIPPPEPDTLTLVEPKATLEPIDAMTETLPAAGAGILTKLRAKNLPPPILGISKPPMSGSPVVPAIETTKPSSAASVFNSQLENLKSTQTSPGMGSPAVAYLQQLKEQLENLHKDLDGVKTQMASINQRNEEQFSEVLRRLEEIKHTSQVEESAVPAPLPTISAPPPPEPEPIAFDASITIAVSKQPEPVQEPPPPPPETGKGPVWPA